MKRLFFIALFSIGFFSLCSPTFAATPFKDVPYTHYAFDAVNWGKYSELVGGYPDGTFKPNQAVTEQQFASMLVKYFDLELAEDELVKLTEAQTASDITYNTLATYGVPLNGYFNNTIRAQKVTRGVVAQAIGYLVDEQTTLDGSIDFLLNAYISTGQNSKYEDRNLAKFFGASNTLTRAQVVTFFYRLSEKNYFYLSTIAQQKYDNEADYSITKRANEARKRIHLDLRLGHDYTNSATNANWNGIYTFTQRYGTNSFDLRGLDLKVTNPTKKELKVELHTYDGTNSSIVEGTAALLTEKKAMLYTSSDDNRCVIEFQKLDDAIKIIEHDCAKERDGELSYSGTVRKK